MMRVLRLDTNNRLSKVILGGPFGERPDAASFAILDRYFACGGCTIETAAAYADGAAEEQVGRWLRATGLRSSVTIIDKCCHPASDGRPRVNAGALIDDVAQSLERLSVDKIDLLLLHRDDERADLGGILRAASGLVDSKAVGAYGMSNWSASRMARAVWQAQASGLHRPSVASLQFSLAVPARPPWPGSLSGSEHDVEMFARMGLAFVAWSSQARGWFAQVGKSMESRRDHAPFDTPTNRARLQRAREVGRHKGRSALQIALAYVIGTPNVAATIGPASTAELEESLGASNIRLNDAERAYLVGSGNP
jgi:1-deoxyxylulose-5-phosphate synthase